MNSYDTHSLSMFDTMSQSILQMKNIDTRRFTPVEIEVSGFSEFVILEEKSEHLFSLCVPQTHL